MQKAHIWIRNNADLEQNEAAIDLDRYMVPAGLEINSETYLGGAKAFRVKEIEVFKVIHSFFIG